MQHFGRQYENFEFDYGKDARPQRARKGYVLRLQEDMVACKKASKQGGAQFSLSKFVSSHMGGGQAELHVEGELEEDDSHKFRMVVNDEKTEVRWVAIESHGSSTSGGGSVGNAGTMSGESGSKDKKVWYGFIKYVDEPWLKDEITIRVNQIMEHVMVAKAMQKDVDYAKIPAILVAELEPPAAETLKGPAGALGRERRHGSPATSGTGLSTASSASSTNTSRASLQTSHAARPSPPTSNSPPTSRPSTPSVPTRSPSAFVSL